MSLETQNTFLLLLLLLFLSATEDSYLLGEIPKDLVDFGLARSLWTRLNIPQKEKKKKKRVFNSQAMHLVQKLWADPLGLCFARNLGKTAKFVLLNLCTKSVCWVKAWQRTLLGKKSRNRARGLGEAKWLKGMSGARRQHDADTLGLPWAPEPGAGRMFWDLRCAKKHLCFFQLFQSSWEKILLPREVALWHPVDSSPSSWQSRETYRFTFF